MALLVFLAVCSLLRFHSVCAFAFPDSESMQGFILRRFSSLLLEVLLAMFGWCLTVLKSMRRMLFLHFLLWWLSLIVIIRSMRCFFNFGIEGYFAFDR